jgi:hypothetical protein
MFRKLLSEKFSDYLKRVRKDAQQIVNVFSKIIYNVIRSNSKKIIEFNFAIRKLLRSAFFNNIDLHFYVTSPEHGTV